MNLRTAVLSSLFASCTSATKHEARFGAGYGAYEKQFHMEEANRTPNATAGNLFDGGESVYESYEGPYWKFRVNVTEITVSDAGDSIKNPTILNTVYDFRWPGSDSLNKAASAAQEGNQTSRLCTTTIFTEFFADVTNSLNTSNHYSNCGSALGYKCENALSVAFAIAGEDHPRKDGCPGDVDLRHISECGNIFADYYETFTTNLLGPAGEDRSGPDDAPDAFPLKSGDGFTYTSTDVYDGSDRTNYERETNRIHMVVLASDAIYTLCTRVNHDNITSSGPGATASGATSMFDRRMGWTTGIVAMATVYLLSL